MRKLIAAAVVTAVLCGAAELFRDDFSRYPAGWLSSPVGQLNAAIQEYHYLPHRGVPTGPVASRHRCKAEGVSEVFAIR